jgi:Family of unknown function (DUF5519)
VSHAEALVDEIANELDTWPGVRIERRSPSTVVVRYENLVLGLLDQDRGVAQVLVSPPEYDELIERGDAEPGEPVADHEAVSHAVEGPSDVTEVLELFDTRYREIRGEDEPYSSSD